MQSKSVVEDTLLKIKAVEEAISENAKGILASTMKEEISELVRESLNGSKKRKKSLKEQEEVPQDNEEDVTSDEMSDEESMGSEEEDVVDVEDDEMEDVEDDEMEDIEDDEMEDIEDDEMEDIEDDEMEVDQPTDDNEMPPLDMTSASPEEVLKVFKAMGDEDGIIVKKEGNFLHLSDNETNKDYLIQTEGKKRNNMRSKINEDVLYEIQFRDDEGERPSRRRSFRDMETDTEDVDMDMDEMEDMYEMQDMYEDSQFEMHEDEDETIYELEMDESEEEDLEESEEEDLEESEEEDLKESFKSKGRIGKMKFKYPSKLKRGVTEISDEESEFGEWDEEEDDELVNDEDDEETETKEASRTMTYRRRAERGRVAAPRQVSENRTKEIKVLREKNEEYKKALDFFRNKLNEVAVFNSNLAYSTRLFTEHSTTKQEKINILRRFDNVETLKESKNLYKTIKNELDDNNQKGGVVKESIERKVTKTPQSGSATNLIESKTYENPQFLRMKDLMTKIK